MPKPSLSALDKRSEEFKVRYSQPETRKLTARAKAYGSTVARFIREITLSDDKFQIISPGNKEAAKRARTVTDLINRLYIHRLALTENKVPLITANLQTDLTQSLNNVTEKETLLWRQITDELNILNAELLGYADDND